MLATTLNKWKQELVQQGVYEGKLETAKKLKEKGLSLQEIAEVTGLSIEEVQKL